jgi:hypothetical protein
MSEAPKRIWADGNAEWDSGSWGRSKEFDNDVEYVRADLAEAIVKAALERAATTTGSHAEDRPLRYSLDFNDGYIDACVAASRTIRALASDPAEVAAIIAKAGEKDNG